MEYIYDDSTKIFEKNGQLDQTIVYDPFIKETEKMLLYLKWGDR
ncbi:hypothetical protein [Enterococcus sp. LJL99]